MTVFTGTNAFSQSTSQGTWMVEANTRLASVTENITAIPSTGFSFFTSDGTTIWSIGGEAGYFIMDDLALKAGLGYTDTDGFSALTYKFGGRYHLAGVVPIELDLSGGNLENFDDNPLWLGLQGGYAFFLSDMVSIEPSARYLFSLNDGFTEENLFILRLGFAIYFSGN